MDKVPERDTDIRNDLCEWKPPKAVPLYFSTGGENCNCICNLCQWFIDYYWLKFVAAGAEFRKHRANSEDAC